MQRFLSAVVLMSVGALMPARVLAQAPPAPGGPRSAVPSATGAATPPAANVSPRKGAADSTTAKPKPGDQLSDEAELSRVVGLYEAGKYVECSTEIERLLDPTGKDPLRQPAIVENARVYWAACLLGAGGGDAADAPLRAAIHENPQMKPPDSLVFPGPVVEHFLRVRDSLVNEIRAAEQARIRQAQAEARQRQQRLAEDRDRMQALEQLARTETLVVRNRRVLSFVPFGVGQIQNRQETLGYTLMASEVVLGSLAVAAIAMQVQLVVEADAQAKQGRVLDNATLLSQWGTVKRVSFLGFAALAVGGVLQAQFAYVPEFEETRPRAHPPAKRPPTSARPDFQVGALPYLDTRGGGLSVVGSF